MGNDGGYGRSVRVSLGIWQVPRVSLWQVRLVRVCCYMPCAICHVRHLVHLPFASVVRRVRGLFNVRLALCCDGVLQAAPSVYHDADGWK